MDLLWRVAWKFLLPRIFFQVMKTNGIVFAYPSHSPESALCKAYTLKYLPRYRNGSNREFLHFYRILTCFIRCSAKYFAGCLGGYVRSLLDDNLPKSHVCNSLT